MLFKCQVLNKDNIVNLTPAAKKFLKNNPMQSSACFALCRHVLHANRVTNGGRDTKYLFLDKISVLGDDWP